MAAEQGDVAAQHNLAFMHHRGWDHERQERGSEMVTRAAEASDVTAHRIGVSYHTGDGVEMDKKSGKRIVWPDSGRRECSIHSRKHVWQGKGVRQDHAEAVKWLRKAAAQGLEWQYLEKMD